MKISDLIFQQLVQVGVHEALDNVDVLHLVYGGCADDVAYVDDVLMIKPRENLDLSQGSLTVGLMLKR